MLARHLGDPGSGDYPPPTPCPPSPSPPPPVPAPSHHPSPSSPPRVPSTCSETCFLRHGNIACSAFLETSCGHVARYAAAECHFSNGSSNSLACSGCCTNMWPPVSPVLGPPPVPLMPPQPWDPGIAAACGAVGGAVGLIVLIAAAVLLRRMRQQLIAFRVRHRGTELHDESNTRAALRQPLGGGHGVHHSRRARTSSFTTPSTASAPSLSPLVAPSAGSEAVSGSGAGGSTSSMIGPMNWGLSVTSPMASTC